MPQPSRNAAADACGWFQQYAMSFFDRSPLDPDGREGESMRELCDRLGKGVQVLELTEGATLPKAPL